MKKYLMVIIFLLLPVTARALPAFPGAEGSGSTTRHAYTGGNPTIYRVNDLDPDVIVSAVGDGTFYAGLRTAIEEAGNRVIIFEVSGTIIAPGLLLTGGDNLWIAGQTAPEPGITVRRGMFWIQNDDILIQHIRIRTGDEAGGYDYGNRDCLVFDPAANVVVDHVSFSWSCDEIVSSWGVGSTNNTFSNCIFGEPCDCFDERGELHAFGPLVANNSTNITFLRSVISQARYRNPRVGVNANSMVVANNVIANWNNWATEIGNSGDYDVTVESNDYRKLGVVDGIECQDGVDRGSVYVADNRLRGVLPADQDDIIDDGCNAGNFVGARPVWDASITLLDSADVYDHVIDNAGAYPEFRDSVDERIITDIGNYNINIIETQDDVGGWPNLAENRRPLTLPANPHDDDDTDGYTNLEEWIHAYAAAVEGVGVDTTSPPVLRGVVNLNNVGFQ